MDKICLKCIFYNPDFPYGCEMSDDLPVVCSVKMKMKKEEIREVKYGREDNN